MSPSSRPEPYVYRPPVPGETRNEAARRIKANRLARTAWWTYADALCAECGGVRFHVSHEMDPDTSPEGPEYHRDIEHHPFQEARDD